MTDHTQEAQVGIPRIGDTAPDFTATTTHGQLTFSEWQGDSWVVLFSHPADFTPVCSTELADFAARHEAYAQKNCKLIGLSIDSIHSHLAWRENLKTTLNTEIPYPIIADLDTQVAQKYGMIHPGESATVTVRAVFLIDPKRTIRALIYYPLNVGRNMDEIERALVALQTSDANGVATPVNWTPGQKVIVPPPKTVDEVDERATHSEYERLDFYLNKKELSSS